MVEGEIGPTPTRLLVEALEVGITKTFAYGSQINLGVAKPKSSDPLNNIPLTTLGFSAES